jgi:branched-chain amino acid transport system substrate-binding protein
MNKTVEENMGSKDQNQMLRPLAPRRDWNDTTGSLTRRLFLALAALAWCGVLTIGASVPALAQEKIRIGIVGPFSGPFAPIGVMFKQGIETYVETNGTHVGGRDVEIIYRDTAGTDPAVAKRLAEELIVRDKVSLLGGFYLSPEAIAAAPVVTETKTPTVLFFAGGSGIPKLSPYFIRIAGPGANNALAMAAYAIKQHWNRAYIAVADYVPGHDMEAVFKSRITEGGGTIVGDDRLPLNTVDYSPFAERIANAKPDVVLGFIPNGAPAVAWYKALEAQGVLAAKVPIIGIVETDDSELSKFNDSLVGDVYSVVFYSLREPGKANQEFKQMLDKKFPGVIPSFGQATAFIGMHVLYAEIASQQGKPFDGEAAVKAVQGLAWEGPGGPVRIVPGAGDLDLTLFVRRVEKVDGHLTNVIVDSFRSDQLK